MSDPIYPTDTGAMTQQRAAKQGADAGNREGIRGVQPGGLRRRRARCEDQATDRRAVAHVTQCPFCLKGHTNAALRHKASQAEIMDALWVAAEMRAGGAYTHSALALDEMNRSASKD